MIDAVTRQKILALTKKIHLLYQEAKQRPSDSVCDICGAGDTIAKTGYAYKVRLVVHGYENRKEKSPYLCHRHASGWAQSHNAYNWDHKRSNEEVDLHFATYLSRQLVRQAQEQSKLTGENKCVA